MGGARFDRGDRVALGFGLVMAAMLALFIVLYFGLVVFVIGGRKGNPFTRLGREVGQALSALRHPLAGAESPLDIEQRWQDLFDSGEYETAADELRAALPLYIAAFDHEATARVYTNLGCTYHRMGDPERALEEYIAATHQHYAAGQELPDQVILLADIRLLREQQGEAWLREQAREWLSDEQAVELLAAVTDAAVVDEPAIEPLFTPYDPAQMVESNRQFADSCLGAGDTMTAATYLNLVGYTFTGMEDRDSALCYHRRALALFETLGNELLAAGGHVAVAGTFASFGEPDSALAEYLVVHDIYAASDEPDLAQWGEWWLQNCLEQLGDERFVAVCRASGRDAMAADRLLELARNAAQPAGGG